MARSFRGHNTHLTLIGLMLIFTGSTVYAACLFITPTIFPGWLNIYRLSDDTWRNRVRHHRRLRRRVHGRLVREQGRSLWTLSGGLAA